MRVDIIQLQEGSGSIINRSFIISPEARLITNEIQVLHFLIRKKGHQAYRSVGVNINTLEIYGCGSGEYSSEKLPQYMKNFLIDSTRNSLEEITC